MSHHTTVSLDAADAIELAELLAFLNDWLHQLEVAASYQRFTFGLCTLNELHADLARFSFLLGGHPGYLDDRTDW
ncbi:MAG TPA: hypothetical protein VFP09_07580 [Desertimonas sp.]|nr:hypothetical protein [Desertimonas sp.]